MNTIGKRCYEVFPQKLCGAIFNITISTIRKYFHIYQESLHSQGKGDLISKKTFSIGTKIKCATCGQIAEKCECNDFESQPFFYLRDKPQRTNQLKHREEIYQYFGV